MIYDIADIAFEQIHNEYYWGKYGDFKVIMNINTRYINATHLCGLAMSKNGNPKQLAMWKLNNTTEELVNEISASLVITRDALFNIISGGAVTEIRGTYVHPDLIPHIASWASPKFAVKVSKIVNAQMVREYKESIRAKDTKIDELTRKMDEQSSQIAEQSRQIQELLTVARASQEAQNNLTDEVKHLTGGIEELSLDNNKLVEDVNTLTKTNEVIVQTSNLIAQKLDIATEDRVPRHPVAACNEMFAIYHRPGSQFYRKIGRQKVSFQQGVRECIAGGFTVCVFQSDSPNAVNLGGRFREALPKDIGKVTWNNITLCQGKTTADLVDFIRATEAEKKNV